MFSQSILAQMLRMLLLLSLTLLVVHHSPGLLKLLAEQAMNSGCHQINDDASQHHSHHHSHH
ncbi:hypothetical protein [Agarivorans albus]|uniref:Uncharacterized protein n=1 Tax=Agarivorans albus MKT 106 TaxID=1331007 RepID=R9PNT4_AGAAL|nr:hypothetical protein [Agarivorans albus]GAD03014.1 hypothetical protein AALB_3094 [Agarivorans albus MKT 106]